MHDSRARYVDGWSRAGPDHLLPCRRRGTTLKPQLRLITMSWQAQAPQDDGGHRVQRWGERDVLVACKWLRSCEK